jgi:hypothetical protein
MYARAKQPRPPVTTYDHIFCRDCQLHMYANTFVEAMLHKILHS